jgi:hypothetical protein
MLSTAAGVAVSRVAVMLERWCWVDWSRSSVSLPSLHRSITSRGCCARWALAAACSWAGRRSSRPSHAGQTILPIVYPLANGMAATYKRPPRVVKTTDSYVVYVCCVTPTCSAGLHTLTLQYLDLTQQGNEDIRWTRLWPGDGPPCCPLLILLSMYYCMLPV